MWGEFGLCGVRRGGGCGEGGCSQGFSSPPTLLSFSPLLLSSPSFLSFSPLLISFPYLLSPFLLSTYFTLQAFSNQCLENMPQVSVTGEGVC